MLPWLVCSLPAAALEPFEGAQVHGFLSQGYILTSGNQLFGDSRHGGSLDYTQLGVNGSWRLLPQLQISAQGLYRRAGVGHENDKRLDYGFLDYTPLSNDELTLGVRLGRVKLPIGLYNATRDVPFTKPTILLPQSIYFERTRDLALSADGGMFYGEHRADWGNISADFGVFSLGVDSAESNLAVFGRNRVTGQSWPGSLQSKPSYISRLMYEHTDEDGGNLRLGITSIWLNAYFDPKLPAAQRLVGRTRYDLEKGDFTFQPWYFSAQYTAENWSLTGEYAFRQLHFQGFGSPMDRRVDGESWYLQGTYRLAPQWQAVARYDVYYANRDDRGGNAVAATQPTYTQYAKDWTVGLRYDITPKLMLQTEYHRVNGTGWLPPLDNPDPRKTQNNWDIFAVLLSYRF
ncbi:OprO/OprP family phosphate-selective porin [Methylogaea oryzae]|uniref:Porin n=1 Tax=Methylogaea oryzae TaxID=1295382 RepID=A0A8D4VSA0_9GAMM|nr:OprO/OprP family phosphate-selective porin [Methylogaea oryzae]BBL71440.1 hypothetical protein MoryE10_20460 [Methylogaea oryzae]